MPTRSSNFRPILLIGGSGRVGKMVIAHLEAMPAHANIVLQTRGVPLSSRYESLRWDPMDGPDALLNWQRQNETFVAMIVLAGATPGGGNDLAQNVDIGNAVVEAGCRAKIPRILLASSSAVYGLGEDLSEEMPLLPINPYGEAKREMEIQAAICAGQETNLCCLRIGNVAGADALLLNALGATKANPLVIDQFADGRGPIRSYIGPASLAEALICLAQWPDPLGPALNVGMAPAVDMIDLARAHGAPTVLRTVGTDAVQHVTLDCTQFQHIAGLPPHAADPAEMVRQWLHLRKSA